MEGPNLSNAHDNSFRQETRVCWNGSCPFRWTSSSASPLAHLDGVRWQLNINYTKREVTSFTRTACRKSNLPRKGLRVPTPSNGRYMANRRTPHSSHISVKCQSDGTSPSAQNLLAVYPKPLSKNELLCWLKCYRDTKKRNGHSFQLQSVEFAFNSSFSASRWRQVSFALVSSRMVAFHSMLSNPWQLGFATNIAISPAYCRPSFGC